MRKLQIGRRVIDFAWKGGAFRQKPDNAIILTGSPRSGTTWVLELLETLPGTRRIWEPFLPGQISDRESSTDLNFGLGLRPYLHVEEDHSELGAFFGRLLSGEAYKSPRLGPHPYSAWEILRRLFTSRRTIIKFCRAQRLLPWLLHRFAVRSILIMRHPLAVVASQLYHPGFQHSRISEEHPVVSERVMAKYPELGRYALSLSHLEEKLAATWCFDYLIPLENWANCKNAILLTYERLVAEPERELSRIEHYLGIKFPKEMFQQLERPSVTTLEGSHVLKNEDPLSTWKSRLSLEKTDSILQVVENFGLDFYTDDLEPNFEKLDEFVNSRRGGSVSYDRDYQARGDKPLRCGGSATQAMI